MDMNSLAHTKLECKHHLVFAPKYRRQITYGKIKADVGQIFKHTLQKERDWDNRGRVLQGSCSYAGKNTTQIQCIWSNGILERKKFANDIWKAREFKT